MKGKLGRLLGVFEVSSHASGRTLITDIIGTDNHYIMQHFSMRKGRCSRCYYICCHDIVTYGVFVIPKAKPRSEAPNLCLRVDCD